MASRFNAAAVVSHASGQLIALGRASTLGRTLADSPRAAQEPSVGPPDFFLHSGHWRRLNGGVRDAKWIRGLDGQREGHATGPDYPKGAGYEWVCRQCFSDLDGGGRGPL